MSFRDFGNFTAVFFAGVAAGRFGSAIARREERRAWLVLAFEHAAQSLLMFVATVLLAVCAGGLVAALR